MKPDESKPVFMYLATNGTLMKIGISNNPLLRNLRMDGLFSRTDQVKILCITSGGREVEAQTHKHFKHLHHTHHKTREWFHCSDEIVRYFAGLPDASAAARDALAAFYAKRAAARNHQCSPPDSR